MIAPVHQTLNGDGAHSNRRLPHIPPEIPAQDRGRTRGLLRAHGAALCPPSSEGAVRAQSRRPQAGGGGVCRWTALTSSVCRSHQCRMSASLCANCTRGFRRVTASDQRKPEALQGVCAWARRPRRRLSRARRGPQVDSAILPTCQLPLGLALAPHVRWLRAASVIL